MSNDIYRGQVYLPDFIGAMNFCKKHYGSLDRKIILDHAFEMTKKIHFRMTDADRKFLFKHATI
jgi:hypothetical protein